jgi:hypothetical protein
VGIFATATKRRLIVAGKFLTRPGRLRAVLGPDRSRRPRPTVCIPDDGQITPPSANRSHAFPVFPAENGNSCIFFLQSWFSLKLLLKSIPCE